MPKGFCGDSISDVRISNNAGTVKGHSKYLKKQ